MHNILTQKKKKKKSVLKSSCKFSVNLHVCIPPVFSPE